MKTAVDLDAHGIEAEKWGTVTLEDLNVKVLELLEGMDRRARIGACGRMRVPVADSVSLYGDSQDEARYTTGVCRCDDLWACPSCAFARQLDTRKDMEAAIQEAKDRGWWVYMLTPTVPHTLDLSLEQTNTVLLDAAQHLKSGPRWQEWAEQIGYQGALRTYEVTHGDTHGWHPHLHFVLFLDRKLEPEKMEAFRRWAWSRINDRVRSWYWKDSGELDRWPMNRNVPDWFEPAFRELHPESGLSIDGAQNAAAYVAKLGLSREVTGFLGKQARGENRTPFQILLDYHLTGSPEDAQLFREYVAAVSGRAKWFWSPGLKGDLLEAKPVGEETEEERLEREAEAMEDRALCAKLDADLYDTLKWSLPAGVRIGSFLVDCYNAGGLEGLRHHIQAQFRYRDRPTGRVELDPDRRYLWLRRP